MNTDGKMSFRDFVFPINPAVIKIRHRRKIAVNSIPFGNDKVTDLGQGARIITGEGEFAGENCINDFISLNNTAKQGGGMLYIPSQEPIYAFAEDIELRASDTEGVVAYSFRFVEAERGIGKKHITFAEGNGNDCLWDYAWKYDVDIDLLTELNPHIRRPDKPVKTTERVRIC